MKNKLLNINMFSKKTNISFMKFKNVNFIISIFLILASLSLITINKLNFGIDFTGGVLIEAQLKNKPDLLNLYSVIEKANIDSVGIQDFDQNNIMVKIGNINKQDANHTVKLLQDVLKSHYQGDIEFRKVDFVGPQIGNELIRKGILAIVLSFLAILIYVAFRFEWQYGVGILISLIHDAIVVLGIISITKLEFDLTSIAAILTIIGYSVNDSVVIYDRIRENIKKYMKIGLNEIINKSINETLSRTTLTVVTTLIAVLVLIIFGGPALHNFSLIVFIGIVIGTYSSIYISAPILIHLGIKKFLR